MPNPTSMNGGVGEPADTCILQLNNDSTTAKQAVVRVTAANLCRSHAAFASLLVDAELRASRVDLNDTKMHIATDVQPGEHAVLIVHLVDLHNGTMCIRLGETEFELELISSD